jgi:predicted nucleic acid-binding protein
MIVLDASAALELLLRAADHSGLVDRVLRSGETIAAPHLLDVEVAHVLRRFVRAGELTEARARQAIKDHPKPPSGPCRDTSRTNSAAISSAGSSASASPAQSA